MAGIPYTTDLLGDYDVIHINTYGPRSWLLLHAPNGVEKGNHAWTFHEGRFSKFLYRFEYPSSFVGKYLASMYQKADFVITPSEYSKTHPVLRCDNANYSRFEWY